MEGISPIDWADKVNSPELLAFLEQFGDEHYLSAEEINELKNKLNFLINKEPEGSDKLDKDGYVGTAKTLAAAIDAIFVPDQLISSVPPTRSVNTFSYPALGYTLLISKTLRTNPAKFETTINAASTTNHKRVDLIYFRPDNTLAKQIGPEDLIIAPRPDVPAGCVGISFINVFGNVIENPTPITNEISIQDYNGVEKFRITDYLRFKGVSFDANAKALVTEPLSALAAYLDPVNGSDTLGVVGNATKPYKTLNGLLGALPTFVNETYTIYMTGGTIPVTRRIDCRNLIFVASTDATLDFSIMKEDDGTTDAQLIFKNARYGTWTFQNENISILSTYLGIRRLVITNGNPCVTIRGTINTFRWSSMNRAAATYESSFYLRALNQITIINCYEALQDTTCIMFGDSQVSGVKVVQQVKIINYYFTRAGGASRIIAGDENNNYTLNIENVIQQGNQTGRQLSFVYNGCLGITLNKFILQQLVIIIPSTIVILNNVVTDDKMQFSFQGSTLVSGNITGVTSPYVPNVNFFTLFKNYTGLLRAIHCYGGSYVTFENCNLIVSDYLVGRGDNSTIENIASFTGFNSITQIDTTKDLFKTSGFGAAGIRPIMLKIDTLTTNATSYGANTSYVKIQSTFKEKLNEVVIRNKLDLVNKDLSSSIKYIIDGNLILIAGEYIRVPAGGLDIAGYGFDTSSISKNVSAQSIFISPAGNSGNLVTEKITYSPGIGSVFNLTDSDGSHALELNDVNFQGVAGSSIGPLIGYRQFTGTTCGIYNMSDGFILDGNWSGFKLTNSNIIGFSATGKLFKKGASLSFSNRFYIDLNLQIATGSVICDFSESNFVNNESLQVINCYNKVGGVIDDSTTGVTFPNISPYSPKSYFSGNKGIKNSNIIPYGINASKLLTYADDTAAASGGVAIGDTYIETSTGYFKKRLT